MPTFELKQTGNQYIVHHKSRLGALGYPVNLDGSRFIREFGLRPGTNIGPTCFHYMQENGYLFSPQRVPFTSEDGVPAIRINLLSVGILSFVLTVLIFTVANN